MITVAAHHLDGRLSFEGSSAGVTPSAAETYRPGKRRAYSLTPTTC